MVKLEKVGAIIQARVQSRKLSRKFLLSLPYGSGILIIENITSRISVVSGIDAVVVATSNLPENDNVVAIARAAGVKVFRRSQDDVLDRVHKAAVLHGFAHIV